MSSVRKFVVAMFFVILTSFNAHSDDTGLYLSAIDYNYKYVVRFAGSIRYHVIGLNEEDMDSLNVVVEELAQETGIVFVENAIDPNFVLVYYYDQEGLIEATKGRNLYLQCKFLSNDLCRDRFSRLNDNQNATNLATLKDREVIYFSSISYLKNGYSARKIFLRDIVSGLMAGVNTAMPCNINSAFCANANSNEGKISKLDASLLRIVYSPSVGISTKWEYVANQFISSN